MFPKMYRLMQEAGEGGNGGGNGDGGEGGEGAGENWRTPFAGDDEKFGKQLERYTTPADFGKAFREQHARISSGELLRPLPENATEDDIKAYREQQGIPTEAAGYILNLPEGMVIGEDDRLIVESFAEALHAAHASPAQFQAGLAWYNKFMDDQAAATETQDLADRQALEDSMRAEYGGDYRANVNVASALLSKYLDSEGREFFDSLRDPDGKAAIHNPKIAQMLVTIGREINPISTILPADKSDQKGLLNRINEIEKVMRENRAAYNADKAMQAEYMELLDIQQKMKARAAA